jgi:hypothetical protein
VIVGTGLQDEIRFIVDGKTHMVLKPTGTWRVNEVFLPSAGA